MNSLPRPPTSKFSVNHDDRHFLAAMFQTVGDRDEGQTIEHDVKSPASAQAIGFRT